MNKEMATAKLVCSNRPVDKKGVFTAQTGRDYALEVDGKLLKGVMAKTIHLLPNEVATLTIVMKLPETVYLDDD